MEALYKRPDSILNWPSRFCPGCMHSTANKIIAEVIDEMGMRENTIAVVPVGCASLSLAYFDVDMLSPAHGRGAAAATGIKRVRPDALVFSYQGDGDLASIGLAETMHAAARGENITVFFLNNAVYGMTGGQMAPTTLPGQVTTTTPFGRDTATAGFPLKMCEIINQLDAPKYIARFSLNTVPNIKMAKRGIRKAFELQVNGGGGYCFIELVTNCCTNWHMTPVQTLKYMEENMLPYYPLGEIRTFEEGK